MAGTQFWDNEEKTHGATYCPIVGGATSLLTTNEEPREPLRHYRAGRFYIDGQGWL